MEQQTAIADAAPSVDAELKPAPITLGRVTLYFELLCELGLADAFDEIAKKRSIPKTQGKATKSLGAELQAVEQEDSPEYVTINLARIFRGIASGGALITLGKIVFEPAREMTEKSFEEAVGRCTAEAFRSAFFPFARESHALHSELVVCAVGYV